MDENEELSAEELATVSGGIGYPCKTAAQCPKYGICVGGVCQQRFIGGGG
ncbi:MAG TPA: bacteriocin [Bryobacteraceae bacterium]|nr:bacteriocin [Bryobacteraceae bacterium]